MSDKLAAIDEQGGGLIVRKKKGTAAKGAEDHKFKAPTFGTLCQLRGVHVRRVGWRARCQ